MFKLIHKDATSKARTGVLHTARGDIRTPVFMPVGTQATVKTISNEELLRAGAQVLLSNTYHLYLRPGEKLIEEAGGLHRFMNWPKPLLTDSGGFQIFSLADFSKVKDGGVEFKSHIDGSKHFLTPERVIEIQLALGSDIIMPLDECLKYPADRKETEKSLVVTHAWAQKSKAAWDAADRHEYRRADVPVGCPKEPAARFGIFILMNNRKQRSRPSRRRAPRCHPRW